MFYIWIRLDPLVVSYCVSPPSSYSLSYSNITGFGPACHEKWRLYSRDQGFPSYHAKVLQRDAAHSQDSDALTDGFKMRRGAIEAGVSLITDIKTAPWPQNSPDSELDMGDGALKNGH